MEYDIVQNGNHAFTDTLCNDADIKELQYQVLKEKHSQKYFIRCWLNGVSKTTEIPINIFSNIEVYLESELLSIRDAFLNDGKG